MDNCRSRVFSIIGFVFSILLIVAGFLVPPLGVIDPSILTAVGLLLIYPSLEFARLGIETKVKLKIDKNNGIEIN